MFIYTFSAYNKSMAKSSNTEAVEITAEQLCGNLPSRSDESHKGSFGSALFIGGSTRYTGAALLAAKACLRSGIGYLNMAIPSSLHTALAGHIPEAIWNLLPEKDGHLAPGAVETLAPAMQNKQALLIGPGLSLSPDTISFATSLVIDLLPRFPELPVIFDADMLTILSKTPRLYEHLPKTTLITPHPGEMARLTGLSINEVQAKRTEVARHFATEKELTLVLKGPNTLIASPSGDICKLNFANSVLAHAGSGDVLAGIMLGLLGQGIPAFEAARLAVWLHAKSGIFALEKREHTASVLPSDLSDFIGHALAELEST